MKKHFFALVQEQYGLTAFYLGEFELAPNHLTPENCVDIVDQYELRRIVASFKVAADRANICL